MSILTPAQCAEISPEYKRLRAELSDIELKLNQLAHRRIDPDTGAVLLNDQMYHEKLEALKHERVRTDNKLREAKSWAERKYIWHYMNDRGLL